MKKNGIYKRIQDGKYIQTRRDLNRQRTEHLYGIISINILMNQCSRLRANKRNQKIKDIRSKFCRETLGYGGGKLNSGEGDCLFKSLSQAINNGSEEEHMKIR